MPRGAADSHLHLMSTPWHAMQVMERVAAVRPAVAELARLEHQAQASFYALKRKWAALA